MKYEILYVMKDIVMSANVNPTINEIIIISSQLSPKIFIMKSISEMVLKIRGEIRYATIIAKIQFKINKISFISPLKYAKSPEKSINPAETISKEEKDSIISLSYITEIL